MWLITCKLKLCLEKLQGCRMANCVLVCVCALCMSVVFSSHQWSTPTELQLQNNHRE